MTAYILRRTVAALLTLVVISIIIFLMLRLLPGDPARLLAGELATAADVEAIRVKLNLNKPLTEQYAIFAQDLLRGDLGKSMRTEEPVLKEITDRLPNTLRLAVISIILSTLVGVPLGILAAVKRYSVLDFLISSATLIGVAMPVYWLGLMLIIIFAVQLQWLPAAGNENASSVILPAVTLALFSLAMITRMTRATTLDVLAQEYMTTARAKGLRKQVIMTRHALRNILIPVVTVVGLQFGSLLGGSILTETIFAWPGLGRLLTESLFARDYPVVQGLVLVYAGLFIVLNFLVDISYTYIDPRIRYD